ncbi:putative phylloplanin [Helianthus anomalus]
MHQALDFKKVSSLTSMAMKSTLLVTLLVVVLVASQAEAQLGGLLGLFNIGGTIFCSANGNTITNATTATPPFANALVQVSCGGNVISSALTNGAGVFSIVLNPLQFLLTNLLSNCNVVVASPLSSCNTNLPSTGILQAPLQLVGTVVRGLLSIVNIIPGTFQLIGT